MYLSQMLSETIKKKPTTKTHLKKKFKVYEVCEREKFKKSKTATKKNFILKIKLILLIIPAEELVFAVLLRVAFYQSNNIYTEWD